MPPNVKPPTQAEIEEALKKSHSAVNPPNPVGADNAEIGAALAQFEKEQGGTVAPQASESVDAMKGQRIEIPESIGTPKMVKFVIKLSGGAIKDQRQAEYVLLGLVIIFMSISFYLFFGGGEGSGNIDPNLPDVFRL